MLTECPSCKTVFRVTPAILKMGHGQVRCGQCRKQFDAIECMLDENEVEVAPEQSSAQESQASSEAENSADDQSYAEEVVMEGSRIEISGRYRIPGDEGSTDSSEDKFVDEHVVIDSDSPEFSEDDSADESPSDDDAIARQDEVIDAEDGEPVTDADNHFLDERHEADEHIEAPKSMKAPAVPKRWRRALAHVHVGRRKEHEEIHAELNALTDRTTPRVLRTGVWATIAGLMVALLIVQAVHHNRDALVRNPQFGNTFSRIYRMLGMSPTPHWDLAAYKWDIYKVGLDPKMPDALRVVGSVANNAPFAQPYPLGKLTLQDRWGGAVGARAFEPYEYLPSPETSNRLMAPKQRANIEIVISDPGADAVGYLIHACLEQDKRLACADQLPVFK